MALIKCPECGKKISDKATSCPNCGYPITINQQQNPTPIQIQPMQQEVKPKNSTLGILALIFSILGCTFFIGIILAIIDIRKKDNAKKTYSIIALVISCFWLLAIIVSTGTSNPEESVQSETHIEEDARTHEEIPQSTTETESVQEEKNDTENSEETNSETNYDSVGDAFKQGFEDNFNISEENQENIDSIKDSVSDIVDDEEVQDAYDNWKESVNKLFGGD